MLLLNHPRPAADEQRLLRMQATVDAIAADIESMHNLAYGRRSEPEPVDLATCLNDVWAGLQHRNPHGTLVLDSQLAPGDVVILDRLALMTVLRNLLRNAIDHAAPGRCVVRRLPQGIAISDDGPGIDPDNLARIFDRFFSLPRSDRHEANPGGAESIGADRGLGLAIARHTALGQDWHLHATSEPGRGTTFTLDFQR
jgi:signal transduction histidine kinase